MANMITCIRFFLLFVLVVMAYQAPPMWQVANAPLLLLIIVLDGVDGYVARKRGETSLFGSVYDIAVDRFVENVLWIVLADLNLVPVWVAIVFITRSLVVDTIRSHATREGETPFGMMRTRWGRFLVAGRFMGFFYGALKALTFGWVLFLQPFPQLYAHVWAGWSALLVAISAALIYASVAVCLLRGIPVVVEFVLREGIPRPAEGTAKQGSK